MRVVPAERRRNSKIYVRSNTHAAGASPGVEAAVCVGGLPRGAVRRDGPHRPPLRTEKETDLSWFQRGRPPVTRHWLHSSPRKKKECTAVSFFAPCFLRALLLPRFDIVRTNEVFWCYSKFLTGASRLARSVLNSRAFCLTHKRSLLSVLFFLSPCSSPLLVTHPRTKTQFGAFFQHVAMVLGRPREDVEMFQRLTLAELSRRITAYRHRTLRIRPDAS